VLTRCRTDPAGSRPGRADASVRVDVLGPGSLTEIAQERLRSYWDADSRTYDRWPDHGVRSASERAAWASELGRLLPPGRLRVLDVGAGTGFLSLTAARLGHEVTALDVSAGMLAALRASAQREGLEVRTVCAAAQEPPQGPFDAVIERLLMWTLPDPQAALAAWREVTVRDGRLVVVESLWTGGSLGQALRRRARNLLRTLRGGREHHGEYSPDLVASLPLIRDPFPDRYLREITAAGWATPTLTRLRDVEFARLLMLSRAEQLLGTTPQYAITATAGAPSTQRG
jgi:SAM-dependent methyltransferase